MDVRPVHPRLRKSLIWPNIRDLAEGYQMISDLGWKKGGGIVVSLGTYAREPFVDIVTYDRDRILLRNGLIFVLEAPNIKALQRLMTANGGNGIIKHSQGVKSTLNKEVDEVSIFCHLEWLADVYEPRLTGAVDRLERVLCSPDVVSALEGCYW